MKNKVLAICNNVKKHLVDFVKRINDKRKFLLFVICILICIFVLFSLVPYLVSVLIGHRVEVSDNEIVSEITSSDDLYTYKDEILLFNSNGMQFYNYNGEHKSTLYFDAYSPYICIKDDILAVADTNGKTATVIKDNKTEYSVKSTENIQLISVNKNTYSAVITNEKGYKSLVEVYNHRGENIYEWHIGEYYAVDAHVTDNNKYLAVLCVGIDENKINSHVIFINLKEENVHSEFKIENELAYKFKVLNNKAYVITDSGIYLISASGKEKRKYGFSGKEMLGFDIDDHNNISIALNDNNSESVVVVLNSRLTARGECNVPIQVTMLDAEKGKVAVAGQNEVYVTDKGRVYAKGTFSKETDRIRFSHDGRHIVTSGGNSICVYDIKLGR